MPVDLSALDALTINSAQTNPTGNQQQQQQTGGGLQGTLSGATDIANALFGIYRGGAQALAAGEVADDVQALRLQQERARQTQMMILFGGLILLTGFALWRVLRKKTA